MDCLNSLGCLSDCITQLKPFQGLPFCYTYIDDVLIASTNGEEHKQHLYQVLSRLQQNGIIINPSKCLFGVHELHFLGNHIDHQLEGIFPLPSEVEVSPTKLAT